MRDRYISSVLMILFLYFFSCLPVFSTTSTDSLLNELSLLIQQQEVYVGKKKQDIKRLQKMLLQEGLSPQQQFDLYDQLYEQYQSFQYDSAFAFAQKLQQKAWQLKSDPKIMYAKLKVSFTLLSSGMYKEAFDSLNTVKLEYMPDSIRFEYHVLRSRAYHDLVAYNADTYYATRYLEAGNRHLDSALTLTPISSLDYYYLRGMKKMKEKDIGQAKKDFQVLLDKYHPFSHEYAKTASSLASIYRDNGETDKAIELMIKAAIADIKTATREALALMNLAELLYHNGDESRAYVYIKQALQDAISYGARQRKIQVAVILPIIEGERLANAESQRTHLFIYSIVVSLLSLLVILFAFIIFKQLRQLRLAKRTVTEANTNLQNVNSMLTQVNGVLQQTNEQLLEANKIKEEYIGYSFNMYSEYLDKIEKLKWSIERKLIAKKFEDLMYVMESINLKKEREDLFHSFDQVFLKLFPNFISVFNSYFRDEQTLVSKDKGPFSIELRIFALIRMGIHDHEQIARILGYSVRTIYNYKTKVKNKSYLSNEEFEQKIMEIRAF